jgi:hypothetical protein
MSITTKFKKVKRISFIIAITLCFAGTANAQFFKKLGNKISSAAEKAVERKAAQKATKETEAAFDSTFNKQARQNGIIGLSKVEPATSYAFSHKVEMQMKSGKDLMDVNYYLPESGNFFCTQIKDEKIKDDFFTVYDADKEAMFTYMKNDGKKVKMGIEFKISDTTDDAHGTEVIDIKATGNTRTILGYKCKEYAMTGENMTGTIWMTKDVDIRFPSNLYSPKQNKRNNQDWMKNIDGWAMEMEMIDTSKRKLQTVTMKCLSIEGSDFKINSDEYSNIGY